MRTTQDDLASPAQDLQYRATSWLPGTQGWGSQPQNLVSLPLPYMFLHLKKKNPTKYIEKKMIKHILVIWIKGVGISSKIVFF